MAKAKMAAHTNVGILLAFVYFASTPAEALLITPVDQSVMVPAGSTFSLTCNITTSSREETRKRAVSWYKGKGLLGENNEVKVHEVLARDAFKRDMWEISEAVVNDGKTKLSTLDFPFVTTKSAGVFSCNSDENKGTVNVTVGNAEATVSAMTDAEIECDFLNKTGSPTISSPFVWYLRVSGDVVEILTCGSDMFPTTTPLTTAAITQATSGTTTTKSPTVDIPTTVKATVADSGNTTTTSTTVIPTTTTTTATTTTTTAPSTPPLPPVAKRVRCGDRVNTMIIERVAMEDEGTYRCQYMYNSNGGAKTYTWDTDLSVRAKPNAPGEPEQIGSTQDSITIRWTPSVENANNAVDNYTVQYMTLHAFERFGWSSPSAIKSLPAVSNTTFEAKIVGLQGEMQYSARVLATNQIGFTTGSTNTILRTAETPPPKPIVLDPIRKSYKITFIWKTTDLMGEYTEFQFALFERGTGTGDSLSIHNSTIPKNNIGRYELPVEKLKPVTTYWYIITSILRAGNETKKGESAAGITGTDIAAPGAPKIVNVTRASSQNMTALVRVVFEPPECYYEDKLCVKGYKLQYKKGNLSLFENTIFDKPNTSDSTLPAYVVGLEMGYIYTLRLAGVIPSRQYDSNLTGNFSALFPTDAALTLPTTTTVPPTVVTDTVPKEPQSDDKPTVIIIVVSVLTVLVITIVIIILIVYKKRKDRGNMSIETEDDLWIDLNTPLLGPASMGYVESEYENIGIDGWAEHCRDMHANSDIKFTDEYETVCQPPKPDITWANSLEPANLSKNRYNNIISYDHTRVILKTQPGVVHSDYINANFIDSYDKTKAFIATQGPLPNTLEDFWRMIWENNSSVIVMITNVYEKHKKKCEQYWPDSGEAKYGRMTVSLLSVEELAYWTIRRFTLKTSKVTKKKNQIVKVIVQYHYTEWPDHGIPEYTLPVLAFVKRSCASNPANGGPIVVHCSAGVGRTGTYIVLEAMMKQIMQKRTVNVLGFLRHTRGLRNHMVQTEDQYIFIHDALLNFIESGGGTDIQPKKFKTVIDELDSNFDSSGETILEKQYKTIVKWSPAEHLTHSATLDVNQNKNRCMSYIPLDNSSRVKLPKIPGENGSDYINATYLHGYFQNKEFIITQHPAAHTEYDFWRMVWDQNSMTLVMLSNVGEEDCVTFYRPKGEPTDWSHKSSFKLTFTKENLDTIDMIIRDFQLESKQDDYEMLTRMFSITCWPEAYTETQSYSDGVFQFLEVVNKWHSTKRNQTGPIIVIDKYGGKAAAQFCALYTLYNQYHHDSTVDLYSLAYLYHMKRPGVWESQNDYRLLYNSMLQLCQPQLEDERGNEGASNGEFPMNTFANVRRINTLPRSPEHMVRTDTL